MKKLKRKNLKISEMRRRIKDRLQRGSAPSPRSVRKTVRPEMSPKRPFELDLADIIEADIENDFEAERAELQAEVEEEDNF